jgi:hypothetical protein
MYKKGGTNTAEIPELHLGIGRSMQFKKLNLFVLVCLQCAKLDHIKLVACIQPPPASGQFRRGVVTMPAL